MGCTEEEFAVVKDNVHEMKGDIKSLVKVITIGNGKPSLLSRIDSLENQTKWIPTILTWMNKSKGMIALISFLGMGGIFALIRTFV